MKYWNLFTNVPVQVLDGHVDVNPPTTKEEWLPPPFLRNKFSLRRASKFAPVNIFSTDVQIFSWDTFKNGLLGSKVISGVP
jgi:hypothetical protein